MQVLNNNTRNTRIENEHGEWILLNENVNDDNDIQIITKRSKQPSKLIAADNGTPQKDYKYRYAFELKNGELKQQDYILVRTSPSLPYFRVVLLRRNVDVFKRKVKQLMLLHQLPELRDLVTEITFEDHVRKTLDNVKEVVDDTRSDVAELQTTANTIGEFVTTLGGMVEASGAQTNLIHSDTKTLTAVSGAIVDSNKAITTKVDSTAKDVATTKRGVADLNEKDSLISDTVSNMQTQFNGQVTTLGNISNSVIQTGNNVADVKDKVNAIANEVGNLITNQSETATSENIIHALVTGFNGIYQALNGPIKYQLFRSPDNEKGVSFRVQDPRMVFSHVTGSGVLLYVTTGPLQQIGRYTYVIVDQEGTDGTYFKIFSDLTLLLLVDATAELLNGCTIVCSCDNVPVFLTPRV